MSWLDDIIRLLPGPANPQRDLATFIEQMPAWGRQINQLHNALTRIEDAHAYFGRPLPGDVIAQRMRIGRMVAAYNDFARVLREADQGRGLGDAVTVLAVGGALAMVLAAAILSFAPWYAIAQRARTAREADSAAALAASPMLERANTAILDAYQRSIEATPPGQPLPPPPPLIIPRGQSGAPGWADQLAAAGGTGIMLIGAGVAAYFLLKSRR